MISFVIPAHNEEVCLPTTLDALFSATQDLGEPFEVIVVNDASTDRTASIARERGVRVLDVQHRHIAATRNAGARAALGDILFFVDADTQANRHVMHEALTALKRGAVGGGCHFEYAGDIPWWMRALLPVCNIAGRVLTYTGGAFLFCRRAAFEAIGGFNERFFAGEDVAFVKSLCQQGRFVIPYAKVRTSNRKLRDLTAWRVTSMLFRLAVLGPQSLTNRADLSIWYGPEARPHG